MIKMSPELSLITAVKNRDGTFRYCTKPKDLVQSGLNNQKQLI